MRIILATIVLLAGYGLSLADSLRCGDRIVSTGATGAEVALVCGEPYWKERREERYVEKIRDGKRVLSRAVEEWTYNFGPSSFIALLRFEEGLLTAIRTGGYGYSTKEAEDRCSDGRLISVGESAGEVALKCGPPAARETVTEEKADPGSIRVREQWVYRFKPARVVVVTMEEGKVAAVESR